MMSLGCEKEAGALVVVLYVERSEMKAGRFTQALEKDTIIDFQSLNKKFL